MAASYVRPPASLLASRIGCSRSRGSSNPTTMSPALLPLPVLMSFSGSSMRTWITAPFTAVVAWFAAVAPLKFFEQNAAEFHRALKDVGAHAADAHRREQNQ